MAKPLRLSCPWSRVLKILSWQSCTGVLSLQSYTGNRVLGVRSWQSCPGISDLHVIIFLSCSACPIQAVLFGFSFSDCPDQVLVPASLLYMSCPGNTVLAVLCWQLCSVCLVCLPCSGSSSPVLAVLFWLSFSAVLSFLSCPFCPVLAVLI